MVADTSLCKRESGRVVANRHIHKHDFNIVGADDQTYARLTHTHIINRISYIHL